MTRQGFFLVLASDGRGSNPQHVGKTNTALPPGIGAFDDYCNGLRQFAEATAAQGRS
jgi:hypothetical protein